MGINDSGILENDLRKLHAEITQIVSQRFQLTTLAILVFAAVCGWATATTTRPGGVSVEFVSLVTVFVVTVFTAIFVYFMLLLGMMRILTVYLIEKYGSHWETDWQEYRLQPTSKKYLGYSKAGTIVFTLLGPLTFFFLLAISWSTGALEWRPLLWLPIVAVLLYIIVVAGAGWARQRLIDEEAIKRNWYQAIQRAAQNRKEFLP